MTYLHRYPSIGFQSTLPRGERLIGTKVEIDLSTISIHAPARGATFLDNPLCKIKCYFNPRSREGSDLRQNLCPVSQTYFNPRSREGSDRKYYLFLLYQRFLLKQYSQITIFSNYTNIKSLILICHFPGANLSGISC